MLNPDLLDRFTNHLKEALQKALAFAVVNGRELVEPGDLVVGLMHEKGSVGAEILSKNGISLVKAESAFRGAPHVQSPVATPDLTPSVKRIIEKCVLIAHLYEHKYVGTEHLLAAVLEAATPELSRFFETCGTSTSNLREQTINVLKSTSRFPELSPLGDEPPEAEPRPMAEPRSGAQRAPRVSALDAFTRDLTKPDVAQTLDNVVGRDLELERVIQILCRRTKNNPILLGEPGVGKTAIVEGLAKRLASKDVPDILHGKRLLTLDLALTVAGTMYRGEFEGRLKQIMEEVKNDPNVILFIDEIHNIVGAGSTTGSLDAANMLKPALARGEIRCVGATTWAEFKKHLEPDAALERRFQPVAVDEPSPDATREMVGGVLEAYAKHHRVQYDEDVVETAVQLAERYLTDRFFPDKAIDLVDEAAASVVARRVNREELERLSALEAAMYALTSKRDEATAAGHLEEASIAGRDADALQRQLNELKTVREKERAANQPNVTAEDVARVVARMAGVPLSTVLASERERVQSLGARLNQSIVGQTDALNAVADVVSRSRLGLSDPRRPKAALLLVGPSGVGKTETARRLAAELFGREDTLVKIDMSEFAESHTVSKLVGSPAGYVGYRESTRLTDALRKRPHAVVLFDEIEKAHPEVQNVLLQILEDGQLADGTGRAINFRHAYVILTSNVGSDKLQTKSLGFGDGQSDIEAITREELKQRFRPELLNRLDRIVVYRPLDREPLRQILRRELDHILTRVESTQRVACTAGDEVLDFLLSRPLPPEEGARAIRRLVEKEVTAQVAKLLAEKPLKKKLSLKVTREGLKVT